MDKKISIIIAAWNADKYIDRAIHAIEKQSTKKIELIVVNDGSTDETKEKIIDAKKRFDNKNRTLILIDQKNYGIAAAFNEAIKHCTGDYLYWQDADDWLEENVLATMADYLDRNTDKTMVRGNRYIVYEDDASKKELVRSKNPKNENVFNDYVFEKDVICFTGIFMARMEDVRKRIGGRGIYTSRAGQNWQLILPLSYKSKCGYIDVPIINYFVRQDSHSHSVKTIKGQIERTKDHEEILKETINRIDSMPIVTKILYKFAIKVKYIKKRQKLRLKRIIRRKND